MDKRQTMELIACLNDCFSSFRYRKDQYAIQLLTKAVAGGMALRTLKQSAYSGLLNKPLVKPLIKNCGDGQLTPQALNRNNDGSSFDFRVSWTHWCGMESWSQVSRPGYQLVLQLNFPKAHDDAFQTKVQPQGRHFLISAGHPVRRTPPHTLAWARIDLDLLTGEALIEEIQTDWLRDARETMTETRCYKSRKRLRRNMRRWKMQGEVEGFADYFRTDLKSYYTIWEEAILSACFEVLTQVIGVQRIYYHNFETGAALKQMEDWLPPRSLYTRLPARFCMRRVDRGPGFVHANPNCRKRIRHVERPGWFLHNARQGVGHDQAA